MGLNGVEARKVTDQFVDVPVLDGKGVLSDDADEGLRMLMFPP